MQQPERPAPADQIERSPSEAPPEDQDGPERSARPGRAEFTGHVDGRDLHIGVAVSRFNEYITSRMLSGALLTLHGLGVEDSNVTVVHVPGAFELPAAARRLAAVSEIDAVLCLGAVIRGETAHFDHISFAASRGIERVSAETGTPVIFGVLTTDSADQAMARVGHSGDYARAAVEMGNLMRELATDGPGAPEFENTGPQGAITP